MARGENVKMCRVFYLKNEIILSITRTEASDVELKEPLEEPLWLFWHDVVVDVYETFLD